MTMIRDHKETLELLYNNFGHIDPDRLFDETLYVKYKGEFVPAANIVADQYSNIPQKIRDINKRKAKFFMSYHDSMLSIAKNLSYSSIKVLLYLMSRMAFNNNVYDVKYLYVASAMGMSLNTVTRSFKELTQKEYITSTGKRTNIVYHINPGVCWKGSIFGMYKKMKLFV